MHYYQNHIKSIGFKLLLLLLTGCIDPYKPPVSKNTIDVLVVDGFINTTTNSVAVKLSHAIALSDNTSYPPEKNATVTIENEDGGVYPLTQKEVGNYQSSISLNTIKKYRLHVRTSANKEYRSAYIELKQSPPLDSITWHPSPEGITIYTNAHDPVSKTHYYEWHYSETWEYNADFYSAYKLVNGKPVYRPSNESLYTCWKTEQSSKTLIESTVRLSKDIVRDFPLTFIPKGSRKLLRKYSITVQQRAIDETAYNYLLQLQKTTENLGGLFDPLPSQVTGNIYNINDSSEPVLGYFRGGSVQEKLIFINSWEVPKYLLFFYPTPCLLDSVLLKDLSRLSGGSLLIDPYGQPFTVGYTASSLSCTDCRVSGGGVLTKPDFWP